MIITINKLLNWYFNKKSLPYWCMLLLDALILFLSGIFSFWLYRKTNLLVEDRVQVFYTMLVFTLFGCIGFRTFRTYSGVVRFSSFVDLSRVAYGNMLAMALAFGYTVLMNCLCMCDFAVFNKTEILLTFVFVLAALGVTSTKATAAQGGIVIGLALTLVHLLGTGITGTSVNPARSFGPAVFLAIAGKSLAIQQVWVFIVAPLVGAALAALCWKYMKPAADSE